VNEHQTVANAFQRVSMQTEINSKGVAKLRAYFEDFVEFLSRGDSVFKSVGDQIPELLYQLEQLVLMFPTFFTLTFSTPLNSSLCSKNVVVVL